MFGRGKSRGRRKSQSIPSEFHSESTVRGRSAALQYVDKWYIDNPDTSRPTYFDENNKKRALVIISNFKDGTWLKDFATFLSTTKKINKDELLSFGSCKQFFSHVKEHYKETFPTAPVFQETSEAWFSMLSTNLQKLVVNRCIKDGEKLHPGKSHPIVVFK